jgi:hypothetical protein
MSLLVVVVVYSGMKCLSFQQPSKTQCKSKSLTKTLLALMILSEALQLLWTSLYVLRTRGLIARACVLMSYCAISCGMQVAGEEITSWCALDHEITGEIQVGICALNFGALMRADDSVPELSLVPLAVPDKKKKRMTSSSAAVGVEEPRQLRWSDLPQVETKRLHTCTAAVSAESSADLGDSGPQLAGGAAEGWKTLQTSITGASAITHVSSENFMEKSGYLEKSGRLTASKRFYHLFEDKLMCYEKKKVLLKSEWTNQGTNQQTHTLSHPRTRSVCLVGWLLLLIDTLLSSLVFRTLRRRRICPRRSLSSTRHRSALLVIVNSPSRTTRATSSNCLHLPRRISASG